MKVLDDMSVREKHLWVEVIVDIVVAVYYFPKLFGLFILGDEALTGPPMFNLIIQTVGLAIILAGIIGVILLRQEKTAPKDEREKQFYARANLIAYRVLLICICGLMGQIVMSEIFAGGRQSFLVLTPVIIANLLMIAIILAEMSKSVMRLFYYRRGY